MINVNDKIDNFVELLNSCWTQLSALEAQAEYDCLKADWLQFTWELAFENSDIKLEVYGDGADINGSSSRISFPELLETHAVYCYPKSGSTVRDLLNLKNLNIADEGVKLDRFVTINEGWFYEKAPFDSVLVEFNGSEAVIGISDLDFHIKKL